MISIRTFLAAALVAVAATANAKVKTEVIEYKQGETVLEGILAYDDAQNGKRPGILIIHDWTGVGPYVKRRAEMLAELGYVAFAADIYGKGVHPKDHAEASKQAGYYRNDRQLLRARAQAGLDVLRRHRLVDATRLAAMGYCFGGGAALELARGGAALKAVASFHGSLDTPNPEDAKNIQAKVLVLHGADDPHISAEQVSAFQEEMRKAGVDWQMHFYGGAVHAFTVPEAGSDRASGAAYDPVADRRSWAEFKAFLAEAL